MILRTGIVTFALLMLLDPASVDAQGRQQRMAAQDLAIDVNTRWPGGRHGGYFPIRIQILNKGETRDLTLQFEPSKGHRLPAVELRIEATQNAPGNYILRVPLVGHGTDGMLKVLDDRGNAIEGLERLIRLPNIDRGNLNPGLPGVLSISETEVPSIELSTAAAAVNRPASGSSSYRRRTTTGAQKVDVIRVSPAELPDIWLDYTTVDIAFIDLRELADLPASKRKPLLQWVQCGGTLVVYNSSADAGDNEAKRITRSLDQILDVKNRAAVGVEWKPAELIAEKRSAAKQAIRSAEEFQLSHSTIRRRSRSPGRVTVGTTRTKVRRSIPQFNWNGKPQAFFQREFVWGTVVAIPGNPFDGTRYDWAWLFKSMPDRSYQWTTRHGFSPRQDTQEFIEFLIPGVKGVPVYAFLFLITAFTILIGPLNYFLAWKRKRLFLLVLTIPIIAFVTSLGLFGYSAVSHGFEIKSRTRSVTILDQRTKESVSISRVAMFAGFAPSDGMEFSMNTAVYPIWPLDKHFEAGQVDWTEGQQLKSGWLPSRTRTQFLAITHRRERGRLEIERKSAKQLEVSNGFESGIKALLVADDNGRLYYIDGIAAGSSGVLQQATPANRLALTRLLGENPLEAPDGIEMRRGRRRIMGFRVPSSLGRYRQMEINYRGNAAETKLEGFKKLIADTTKMKPRSYVAIFEGPPNIELGVEETTPYVGFHVVFGHY